MIEMRAIRHYGGRHNDIAIFIDEDKDGKFFSAAPIVMEERQLYESDFDGKGPAVSLTKHTAQILIDSLWDCGLRPSEGSGSAGQLAAVQNHLADMRKLLSKVPLVEK